jgi:hypothetical protein
MQVKELGCWWLNFQLRRPALTEGSIFMLLNDDNTNFDDPTTSSGSSDRIFASGRLSQRQTLISEGDRQNFTPIKNKLTIFV